MDASFPLALTEPDDEVRDQYGDLHELQDGFGVHSWLQIARQRVIPTDGCPLKHGVCQSPIGDVSQ